MHISLANALTQSRPISFPKARIADLSLLLLVVLSGVGVGLHVGRILAAEPKKSERPPLIPSASVLLEPRPEPTCGPPEPAPGDEHPVLRGFRGDVLWIHRREGHVGAPYWPGGDSGVTLDPGIDLGHSEPWLVRAAYGDHLTKVQGRAVERALGIHGPEAERLLRRSAVLRGIRTSRSTAAGAFPYLLRPYWRALNRRFDRVDDPDVPAEVQTALLSLAYNRGTWNRDLTLLHRPLAESDWRTLAHLVQTMQQNHRLQGIRQRRRIEGLLIAKAAPLRDAPLCRSRDLM